MRHTWRRRPAFVEEVRRSHGASTYTEKRTREPWDQCSRCGMSRGMVERIRVDCHSETSARGPEEEGNG